MNDLTITLHPGTWTGTDNITLHPKARVMFIADG